MTAEEIVERMIARGLMLATAESCTGGLVAAAITDVAGASNVMDRGFVTYSNAAKTQMLGVPEELIDLHGAVSAEVAQAMVLGALAKSNADVAVAITGIAGPGGGSLEKPVGLVHFGCAMQGRDTRLLSCVFEGEDRAGVRKRATEQALALVWQAISAA